MLKQVQHDEGGFDLRAMSLPLLALLAPAAASARELPPATYPPLPSQAHAAEAFVPNGWRIEAQTDGDLDGDGKADLALVLRETDSAKIVAGTTCEQRFDTNERIVAVLLAHPGGYRLAGKSHRLIPRRENPCAVDPFSDPANLAIERGTLRITLERMMAAGGWDAGLTTYKWRWRDGAFRLIGFDYSNVRRNSGAMALVSINYLTGRVKITTGSIEADRTKVRWTTLRDRRAPTLDGAGDGLAFDPEGLLGRLP